MQLNKRPKDVVALHLHLLKQLYTERGTTEEESHAPLSPLGFVPIRLNVSASNQKAL